MNAPVQRRVVSGVRMTTTPFVSAAVRNRFWAVATGLTAACLALLAGLHLLTEKGLVDAGLVTWDDVAISYTVRTAATLLCLFPCVAALRRPRRFLQPTVLLFSSLPFLFLVMSPFTARRSGDLEVPPAPICGPGRSHEILFVYRTGGREIPMHPAIAAQAADASNWNPLEHANAIEAAWYGIRADRKLLVYLPGLDSIQDVPSPQWLRRYVRRETEGLSPRAFRSITQTYCAYARLLSARGRHERAAKLLAELNAVAHAVLPGMSLPVHRCMWIEVATALSCAAYDVASDSGCSEEALRILHAAFPPHPPAFVALRSVVQTEYQAASYLLEDWYRSLCHAGFPRGTSASVRQGGSVRDRGVPSGSCGFLHLYLRPNRYAAFVRRYCALALDGSQKIPPDIEAARAYRSSITRASWRLGLGEAALMNAVLPDLEDVVVFAFRGFVYSHLLTAYLHDRIGDVAEERDPYTGRAFLRDADGLPFSVGPDGVPGTSDDIRLVNSGTDCAG